MELRADLHVHTCLSPCAEPEMVPTAIIAAAKAKGLSIIGICDHNSAENVPAVKACARGKDLLVLGGMEVTSAEEAHMIAYFEDDRSLSEAQKVVYDNLDGTNDEAAFGCQWIVDADDFVVGTSDRLLIGATRISADDLVRLIRRLGGIVLAAHVDRESFSLPGQLGFIPPELELDGLDVSPEYGSIPGCRRFEQEGRPLVRSSDAHCLADIGRVQTFFTVERPTFAEVMMALHGRQGRAVRI